MFASGTNEYCLYGDNLERCEKCVDCTFIYDCQECYNSSTLHNCYHVYDGFDSQSCRYCEYISHCSNCEHCFACFGIHGEEYYILNQPVSKDEYEATMSDAEKRSMILQDYEHLKNNVTLKYYTGYNIENSTGDYLYNCQNLQHAYITENSKDSKYITFCRKTEDCMDFDFFGDT